MSTSLQFSQFCKRAGFILLLLLAIGANPGALICQTLSAKLHGDVTDPTGAMIPGASVTAKSPSGKTTAAKTNGAGAYEFKNLPPGDYTVTVQAENFGTVSQKVKLAGGEDAKLNVALKVAPQKGEVVVEGQSSGIDLDPANNSSATVIRGSDLDRLSDDPDELQSELSALAGPAVGPNGGEVYVDGFSGGQLPSKASIREIRINQNPFSAQYDHPGYGRIEVFTRAGTDKFHGNFAFNAANSIFNSRNPLAPTKPDYHWWSIGGLFSGPINKKASFSLDLHRDVIGETLLVNAILPSPAPGPTPDQGVRFTQAVLNPKHSASITPRIDYALTPNNTLTARYSFSYSDNNNEGIGDLVLPSQGSRRRANDNNLQLSDTQVVGTHSLNDARFQFDHNFTKQNAVSADPAVSVPGFFVGGGTDGNTTSTSNHYEFADDFSLVKGKHVTKFGGRLRANALTNFSTQNFNGTFTYKDLPSYEAGTPEFFFIAAGNPSISQALYDVGIYCQDDWRLRPNVTASFGVRYETQTVIGDYSDVGPRVAVAWGIDGRNKKAAKTILRTGWGMFYDRFNQNLVLQAERLNGVNQQQFLINNPLFSPNTIPSLATLRALNVSSPSLFQIDPKLRAPYMLQTAVTLEREIAKGVNFSLTYANTRGLHQFLLRDINAPLPGTLPANFSDPGSRALGGIYGKQNVYQYESAGIFKQNQLIGSINIRLGTGLMVGGFYLLNNAHSDSAGPNSYASNDFNVKADYGRTSFDVHHRLNIYTSMALPFAVRASPSLLFFSGQPYNITSPIDLNGDGQLNDRPAFVSSATLLANNIPTPSFPIKSFDIAPAPGALVLPPYYATAPSTFAMNISVSKTVTFGPHNAPARANGSVPGGPNGSDGKPAGNVVKKEGLFSLNRWGKPSDQKYSLTFSMWALNMLNGQNFRPPVGVVGQRLGQPYAVAGLPFSSPTANRRISLQARFAF